MARSNYNRVGKDYDTTNEPRPGTPEYTAFHNERLGIGVNLISRPVEKGLEHTFSFAVGSEEED